MKHRGQLSAAERQARSRLTRLVHESPFLCGSLVTLSRRCGKPGCKCVRGERHQSLALAVRVGRARKMLHVPKEHEEQITRWVQNYREIKDLMDHVSAANLQRWLAEKEAR